MKKLIYIFILFLIFTGVIGCGDNDNFSSLHVLTDDEIAEMHRQDSIDSVNRSRIDADLILDYTIETYATAMWAGADKNLSIDLDQIGELFGLTPNEVLAGINQEDGAPAIKGYAILASNHNAIEKPTTTNGSWGHWWTTDGDLCDEYDQANSAFFCEWQGEYFTIGQFPGHIEAGFSITVLECLKYQDKKVAIQITFSIIERGSITAPIVNTMDLALTMDERPGYDSDPLAFDRTQVLGDLGISSLDEAQIISVKADGSYVQETTATNGYWYDLDGYPGSHGDNASIYVEYYGLGSDADPDDLDVLYVGQMPNALQGPFNKTFKYGFMANNKIVMLNITVDIPTYVDPETPSTGTPVTDAVINVTIEKSWDDTFSNERYDIQDALRDAFKMTTYQIHWAKVRGDLKIYCDALSTEDPTYTSDVPGYWLNSDGEVCKYEENAQVFCCLGSSNTALWIYAGNHPSTCVPNTTVTTKYLISCNGGMVTANITVKIGDEAP